MEIKEINRLPDDSDDDGSPFKHAHEPCKRRDAVTMIRTKEKFPEEEEEKKK